MDRGQTVFRGEAYTTGTLGHGARWYISEATVTGVEVDGVPMARVGALLTPVNRYVESKTEAKQQVVDELVREVSALTKQIETLRDEILHECLTTQEAT